MPTTIHCHARNPAGAAAEEASRYAIRGLLPVARPKGEPALDTDYVCSTDGRMLAVGPASIDGEPPYPIVPSEFCGHGGATCENGTISRAAPAPFEGSVVTAQIEKGATFPPVNDVIPAATDATLWIGLNPALLLRLMNAFQSSREPPQVAIGFNEKGKPLLIVGADPVNHSGPGFGVLMPVNAADKSTLTEVWNKKRERFLRAWKEQHPS